MSSGNLPAELDRVPAAQAPAPALPPSLPLALGEEEADWRRVLSAVARYKWLVALVTLLGTVGAWGATRFVKPEYLAQATIWIQTGDRRGPERGPIRSGQLLEAQAWVDLLQSYVVLEQVVRDLRLYLDVRPGRDSVGVVTLTAREGFTPGAYRLTVETAGAGVPVYRLFTEDGVPLESGQLGDSVGRRFGLAWTPTPGTLAPGQTVAFQLLSIRDAARRLAERLAVTTDPNGNFVGVELRARDPVRAAAIVNAVAENFVRVASELKRERLTELTRILDEQLHRAEQSLRAAEIGLENFRVQTITLPADRGSPVTPGLEVTRDPVFSRFFDMKFERDELRRDREALERTLAAAGDSGIAVEALEMIPSAQRSLELKQALDELRAKQADVRALRYRYTDAHPPVQRLLADIGALRSGTIPALMRALVAELAARETELGERVSSTSRDLRQIPPRAIEEARLRRDVVIAENLFTMLQQRYEEARLAEASSIPDVRVLDPALVPREPVKDAAPRVLLMGFLGSLVLAILGAVVLDRVDPRLHYPQQVTREMGLVILGAVPHLRGPGPALREGEADEVIEAMRGIRLNLLYAYGTAGPVVVTLSSPGPRDGKSFVSANLALAFAHGGSRTLLIDGDLRRGTQHRLLSVPRKPGLTDYLRGEALYEQVVRATSYPGLDVIGEGTRTSSAPELLALPAFPRLLAGVRSRYDVVLVDSPPLGAGVDPFVLATATGHLLLVLRTGVSHRDVAEAKLEVLSRLPVRILGAVLNDVPAGAPYRYYSYYLKGYEAQDEGGRLASVV